MTRNLMVCAHSNKPLTVLHESAGPNKDIYLEGIFAELDVKNRNNRIYTKEEYLKHLDYLRADIREGQSLLGELDHPEDRFEVKMKEASHQIVDIWYDSRTNCVMGKIRLLRTPNGLLAQSILEQGIPLHISSRAAGTVNSDNTVKIQQIYTYDLVCKPGFAKAVLHTVNESVADNKYSDEARSFMLESEAMYDKNIASLFGVATDSVLISEMASSANFRQEALAIQQLNFDNDMINENKDMELEGEVCPDCAGTGNEPYSGTPCPKCNGNGKLGMNEDEEVEKEEDSSDENEDNKEESDDKGVEILGVEAVTGSDEEGDGVEIKDVEATSDENKSDDESEEDSEEESDGDESEETENEQNEDEETAEAKKPSDKQKEMLLDCDDIKKRKDSFEDKFADLVDAIKKKGEDKKKNESMTVSQYPMSALLNEGMFAEFMAMNEAQKSNVMSFITESNINPSTMSENVWESAKTYVPETENWLRYAPANYKALYESADDVTKASIRNTAQYFLFENQHDINAFWRNTGLKEKAETAFLNEQFVNNMPRVENVNESNDLGYSTDYINMIAEMASAYN